MMIPVFKDKVFDFLSSWNFYLSDSENKNIQDPELKALKFYLSDNNESTFLPWILGCPSGPQDDTNNKYYCNYICNYIEIYEKNFN
jgi:hypothetical protein